MSPQPIYSAYADPADFEKLTTLCRESLAEPDGIAFLAHYTYGVHDFTFDLTGRLSEADLDRYGLLGRQLNFSVGQMADNVRALGNGELIRTVLETESGAVFRHRTRPDEHLVAVTRHKESVTSADEKLSQLATDIRKLYKLGPENPGGYQKREPPVGRAEEMKIVEKRDPALPSGHDELVERCTSALDIGGLHYLGHSHGGRFGFSVDVLDHRALRHWTRQVGAEVKRQIYQEAVRWLPSTTRRLNRQLRPVLDGDLRRTVLDVHEGAIYYHQQAPGEFFVGVTLDQDLVEVAEAKLTELREAEPAPPR